MTPPRARAIPLRAGGAESVHDVSRCSVPKRRIVVLGEVNAGKTSVVNAIAGAEVLPVSSLTHTVHPTVVRYSAKPFVAAEDANRRRARLHAVEEAPEIRVERLHVGVPSPVLRDVTVIDTPGLGGEAGEPDPRTLALCRRADAVIWCTPAMQAWKASEAECWMDLPRRVRNRGLLAVTFADAVPPDDLARLMARLENEAGALFQRVVLASDCSDVVRNLIAV